MKKYSGWFNLNEASQIYESVTANRGFTQNGSLVPAKDKLILNIEGKTYEILKSEISSVEYLFIGRYKIIHSNSSAPEFLIFSAWWSLGLSKLLKDLGYNVK